MYRDHGCSPLPDLGDYFMSHINLFLHARPYLHSQRDIQHLQGWESETRLRQESAPSAHLPLPAGALTHRVHPADDLFKLVGPSHQSTASSLGDKKRCSQDFLSPCIVKSLLGAAQQLPSAQGTQVTLGASQDLEKGDSSTKKPHRPFPSQLLPAARERQLTIPCSLNSLFAFSLKTTAHK